MRAVGAILLCVFCVYVWGACRDLRINQIQITGTHNSYHIASNPSFPDVAYNHPNFTMQLDNQGVRGLELDFSYDGGLFTVKHARLDPLSWCANLGQCLSYIKAWMGAQPSPQPFLFIMVENKDDTALSAAQWDEFDTLATTIFTPSGLLRASDVAVGTVRAGIIANGWPRLSDMAGKVMLVLDSNYPGYSNPSSRVGFLTSGSSGNVNIAVLKINDALGNLNAITNYVNQGFIVRTFAESNLWPLAGEPNEEAIYFQYFYTVAGWDTVLTREQLYAWATDSGLSGAEINTAVNTCGNSSSYNPSSFACFVVAAQNLGYALSANEYETPAQAAAHRDQALATGAQLVYTDYPLNGGHNGYAVQTGLDPHKPVGCNPVLTTPSGCNVYDANDFTVYNPACPPTSSSSSYAYLASSSSIVAYSSSAAYVPSSSAPAGPGGDTTEYNEEYAKDVAKAAGWPIGFAVLTLLAALVYFPCRCCCQCQCCPECCVNMSKTCCGGNVPNRRSGSSVVFYLVLLAVVWAGIIIVVGVGLAGDRDVHSEVTGTADDVVNMLLTIQADARFCYNVMAPLGTSQADSFRDVENGVGSAVHDTDDIRDKVVYYDGVRKGVVDGSLCMTLLILAILVIALIFRIYALSHVFMVLTFIAWFFLFLVCGSHLVATRVQEDGCGDAGFYFANINELRSTQFCVPTTDTLAAFDDVTEITGYALTDVRNRAYAYGVNIDDTLLPVDILTAQTVYARSAFIMLQVSIANATIGPSAHGAQRDGALEAMANLEQLTLVGNKLARITSCQYFTDLLNDFISNRCTHMNDGLKKVNGSTAAAAFLLIPAVVFAMVLFAQMLIPKAETTTDGFYEGVPLSQHGQHKPTSSVDSQATSASADVGIDMNAKRDSTSTG